MTFSDIRTIYTCMQDEISRKLFIARLNVSLTGDAGHLTMLSASYRNLSAVEEVATSQLPELVKPDRCRKLSKWVVGRRQETDSNLWRRI